VLSAAPSFKVPARGSRIKLGVNLPGPVTHCRNLWLRSPGHSVGSFLAVRTMTRAGLWVAEMPTERPVPDLARSCSEGAGPALGAAEMALGSGR